MQKSGENGGHQTKIIETKWYRNQNEKEKKMGERIKKAKVAKNHISIDEKASKSVAKAGGRNGIAKIKYRMASSVAREMIDIVVISVSETSSSASNSRRKNQKAIDTAWRRHGKAA